MNQFTIDDCHALAEMAHAGQLDKAGQPFIEHPIRVALLALKKANSLSLPSQDCLHCYMAGLLHDVIEDTPYNAESLRRAGVPEGVIKIVILCTRDDQEPRPTYMDWIRELVASRNIRAIVVKWADNQDNSSPARLACLPAEMRGIGDRYLRAQLILNRAIDDHILSANLAS